MNILLVDDDSFFRKFYATKLSAHGFTVQTVSGGKEALEYLDKTQPDAMLLDLIMPQIDGFEVLTHVKQMPQLAGMPIIVFSTLSQPQDIERAKALGALDFVNKSSLNFEALVSKMQALSKKRAV